MQTCIFLKLIKNDFRCYYRDMLKIKMIKKVFLKVIIKLFVHFVFYTNMTKVTYIRKVSFFQFSFKDNRGRGLIGNELALLKYIHAEIIIKLNNVFDFYLIYNQCAFDHFFFLNNKYKL